MEASGPKIGPHYQPQKGNLVVLVSFTTYQARCPGGGRRPRSQLRVEKGIISPLNTMEASGPKIGRHYQPQKGNLVVLVTFTTFHARCSGGGRRPRSQLRVDQGYYLTTEHGGSKRTEDWTSLPATKRKLGCCGYFHDLSRSLFGWGKAPKITAAGGSRVLSYH